MQDPTRPYTQEVVVIHRVFRREAALLLRIVIGARAGDVVRAVQVATAIRDYTDALQHHHRLEDELLWPLLRSRARLYGEQVSRMEDQHGLLEKNLLAIGDLLPHWEAGAAGHLRDELAERLAEHRRLLVEHLDDEEEMMLPLIADHLTADEWDRIGRRGLTALPRADAMMALGAILEEAAPEERRHFLAKVPASGRLLWWVAGRHRYARRTARLREPRP